MAESAPLYDVAIVGLGPTGATLANLLGAAGLSVLVLEKEAGIFPLPRAIHFDGEVLRVLQSVGLREQALAIARPGTQGMHFVNGAGRDHAGARRHGRAGPAWRRQQLLLPPARAGGGAARGPGALPATWTCAWRHELVGHRHAGRRGATLHGAPMPAPARRCARATWSAATARARRVRQHMGQPDA
ncbi:MAG: FAD-dependent monooxygenase [Pseudorhodoferax sp.]